MIDVQIATNTTSLPDSSANPAVSVSVPDGRVAVSGGFSMSHPNRGICQAMYPVDASTWTFKFGNNQSGQTNTITVYVVHIPETENVEVVATNPPGTAQVLRVKP